MEQLDKNFSNFGNKMSEKVKSGVGKIEKIGSKLERFRKHRLIGGTILIVVGIVTSAILIFTLIYIFSECDPKRPFMKYLYGFNPTDVCDSAFVENGDPDVQQPLQDPEHPTLDYLERETLDKEEVFHISDQKYTYDEAKCKCRAYGAELADLNQMTKAYNEGGEWCTYGWSKNQHAYYPTQACTAEKLKRSSNPYACGLPGVNGGYFANKNLRFGVNCFGVKPKGEVVLPKKSKCKKKSRCKAKTRMMDSDVIVPFNKKEWSQY